MPATLISAALRAATIQSAMAAAAMTVSGLRPMPFRVRTASAYPSVRGCADPRCSGGGVGRSVCAGSPDRRMAPALLRGHGNAVRDRLPHGIRTPQHELAQFGRERWQEQVDQSLEMQRSVLTVRADLGINDMLGDRIADARHQLPLPCG